MNGVECTGNDIVIDVQEAADVVIYKLIIPAFDDLLIAHPIKFQRSIFL